MDKNDPPEFGTNVIPKQMSREQLRNGYIAVMGELNDVHAFFDRADSLYADLIFSLTKLNGSTGGPIGGTGFSSIQSDLAVRCALSKIDEAG